MTVRVDHVRALADRLLGTCEGAVDEIEDLSVEECALLDSLVMCCTCCNWWVEGGEIDDDGRCEECQ